MCRNKIAKLPTLTLSLSGMVTLVETASGLGKIKLKLKRKKEKILILNSLDFGIKRLGINQLVVLFVL